MQRVLTLLTLFCACAGSAADSAPPVQFDIAPQSLSAALVRFSEQARLQFTAPGKSLSGVKTAGVKGKYPTSDALALLLKDTGLTFRFVDERTVSIHAVTEGGTPRGSSRSVQESSSRLVRASDAAAEDSMRKVEAQNSDPSSAASSGRDEGDSTRGIPEILVKGSRSLNTDIARTEDGVQPYVVFNKEEIQRSQAINLSEFLRTRLPMNTSDGGWSTGSPDTMSSINLRGLGSNQTLVLVDGRRMPGRGLSGGNTGQPDINGIPLAAIERIEVLPSTAGGIYGGSATGGVINVILRRDFRGMEAKITYANTFDTDTGRTQVDATTGFSLEGGKTTVMVSAVHLLNANSMTVVDRDLQARGLALQLKNNPALIVASTTPPLGATVNIRSAGGEPLVLDTAFGGTALGSNITHLPLGYAGAASDNGSALVANAGRYNLENPHGSTRGGVAVPSMSSFSVNVRRQFGSRIDVFVDMSRLDNQGKTYLANIPTTALGLPANAPNNPFQQAINVRFPSPSFPLLESRNESLTEQLTAGVVARLPYGWTGSLDYGWSRSRNGSISQDPVLEAIVSAVNGPLRTGLPAPDGRPALNALQEGNTYPLDFSPYMLPVPNWYLGPNSTTLKDIAARLSGPALSLPGGQLNLSALIERQHNALGRGFYTSINSTTAVSTTTSYPEKFQDVDSCYLEARAPLISAGNARSGLRELELQVTGRYDAYRTRSKNSDAQNYVTNHIEATKYTLGMRYMPLEDVALRVSFGSGFLPPAVDQIAVTVTPNVTSNLAADPKRGGTPMYTGQPYTYLGGGNPDLRPEQSRSWSAGMVLTPRFVSDLRVSVDYTRIDKTDEIIFPLAGFIIENEDELPGRIVRGERLPGDPIGWAGPISLIDTTRLNINRTWVGAYDLQADYTMRMRERGELHFYALATWQPRYRNQLVSSGPMMDRVGYTGGILEWRGNAGVNWSRGALTIGWNAQYYDSYLAYAMGSGATENQVAAATAANRQTALLNQGSVTIPSQIYHDLIANYGFQGVRGVLRSLLNNSELTIGIQNVLNTSPPILAATNNTLNGYSAYGDPRLRRYSLVFRKNF